MLRAVFLSLAVALVALSRYGEATADPELLEKTDADVIKKVAAELGPNVADEGAAILLEPKMTFDLPDPLYLPHLPMFAGHGVSLSLSDVYLYGLSAVDLKPSKDDHLLKIQVHAPALITLCNYVASGSLNDLPFVGESTLNMTIDTLDLSLSYKPTQSLLNYCVKKDTYPTFSMDMTSLTVNFQDLDPGQADSGDMINSFLSNLTDDISDWLTLVLNDESKGLLTTVINTLVTKTKIPGDCTAEKDDAIRKNTAFSYEQHGDGLYLDHKKKLAEFLSDVPNKGQFEMILSMIVNALTVPEDF